jgi:predicted ATPase
LGAQPQAGLDRLAEAAKLVETTQERWAEAEMHRLRGTLLLALHDVAAAENSFQQALTIAQHQSAKLWELRATTSLARLRRDQGKRTEARDLLAPIYGWQDAKALLDELASA